MPAATPPPWSIPYPVGTDRVADGDNAMQALAERVAAVLGTSLASGTYAADITNLPLKNVVAKYARAGAQVTAWGHATVGSGAVGQNWAVAVAPALPLDPALVAGLQPIGICRLLKQGAGYATGFITAATGTYVSLTDQAGANWGWGAPFQVIENDAIAWWFTYPAAAATTRPGPDDATDQTLTPKGDDDAATS